MSDIWTAHQRFQHLGAFQQRQWVLDYLHSNSSKETKETLYLIAGKGVCLPVWLGILGLSKSRLYEVRKAFRDGILFVERLTSPKFRQHKSYEAVAWMRLYFNQVGDHMPDRMAIHLPSFLTHASVYGRMKEDMESRNQSIISSSHFYNLWSSEFSHVTIPKENRFTKCDTCTLVRNELQITTDPDKRKVYSALLEKHNQLQKDQRLRYYDHRQLARQEPNKYMCIIIDGMDQSKTDLPHLARKNKSACNMWVMRTHLTGALAHGRRSFAFVDLHLWPHDSNLSVNVLLQILLQQSTCSKLPPILYLQLDNCFRENKNQFFFGFIALLVHHKIFKEVEVAFLMVGHTHEDIDQFFSKLSQYLRYNDAHTLPDLLLAITNCYADVPEANLLEKVYDVKSWLEPYLLNMYNHSHPHIFRFTCDSSGEVVMHYKDWNKSPWQPSRTAVKIFKNVPEGCPKLLRPSLDRLDFSKLSSHARQYRMRCGMSEDAQGWWLNYIAHLEQFCSNTTDSTTSDWPLQHLVDSSQDSRQPEATEPSSEASLSPEIALSELPNHLLALYEKENGPHPQVYTGWYRRSRGTGGTSAVQTHKQRPSDLSTQSENETPTHTENESQTMRDVQEGELIALCCPNYNERPQLAKVLSILESKIKVRWYDGSWSSKWTTYTYYRNRKKVTWDEEIDTKYIVMTSVKLTPCGRLTASCKRKLKKLYK